MDARHLPTTVLESALCYLMELGPDDEIRIPWDRLNEIDNRVALEHRVDKEYLILSTVDVDTDATDAPEYPSNEIRGATDLGKGETGF